jgi:hypothetical protein
MWHATRLAPRKMKTGSVLADIKSLAGKSVIYGLGNII